MQTPLQPAIDAGATMIHLIHNEPKMEQRLGGEASNTMEMLNRSVAVALSATLERDLESRRRINFDIWKFPIDSDPLENVRRALRITHQTGQVQTPSQSPDGRQLVYLSDTGGHGNLWVMDLASGQSRQITFEKAPGLKSGCPCGLPTVRRLPTPETMVLLDRSLPSTGSCGRMAVIITCLCETPPGSPGRGIRGRLITRTLLTFWMERGLF
jgi:hypothetical protein